MKITIESTSKVVDLVNDISNPSATVPARIWEGETDSGIKVHCYITRIAIDKDNSPEVHAQFEKELLEQRAPSAEFMSIPLRLIL